jgi:hypothetical protein
MPFIAFFASSSIMKVESVLDRAATIAHDKLRDEDHLERHDLIDKDATRGFVELYEWYKTARPGKRKQMTSQGASSTC